MGKIYIILQLDNKNHIFYLARSFWPFEQAPFGDPNYFVIILITIRKWTKKFLQVFYCF